MISYCIASYRPAYSRHLVDELVRKTTVPYEILLWLNVADAGLDRFLTEKIGQGVPLRIMGRTPSNIGMAAYANLFASSRFEMVVQIDDDVVFISPRIAETAAEVFLRFPNIGMLTADVWQDEFTNGARPPMEHYREVDSNFGLFDGPIDGWFAVYRKSSLCRCRNLNRSRYYALGCAIRNRLRSIGQTGLLCTKIKVFHVTGPQYASYFGMLDFEIAKYTDLGLNALVDCYKSQSIPPRDALSQRINNIRVCFESPPD